MIRQGDNQVSELARHISALCDDLVRIATTHSSTVASVAPGFRESALNLLQYLELRHHDIRHLQESLAELGLSSLGRSEAHVLESLTAVRSLLDLIQHDPAARGFVRTIGIAESSRLLAEHTSALFGRSPAHRDVRIMVTMPSEAAGDPDLVREMLAAGMDVMRINCAHDGPDQWQRMIANLEAARAATGRACTVFMDLAGPKLRTGAIATGPGVIRIHPKRDAFGRVTSPARVWLTPEDGPVAPPSLPAVVIALDRAWVGTLQTGDEIVVRDTRGARRRLQVTSTHAEGSVWADCFETTYAAAGTRFSRIGERGRSGSTVLTTVPERELPLMLRPGDPLVLTRTQSPGHPAVLDQLGRIVSAARIPCTLPEAFDAVKPGEPIWLDDGKVGGTVAAATHDEMLVRITHARADGTRLRAEKGINLPETKLDLVALTQKDSADLEFVARHADMVGLSFVGSGTDVSELQARLHTLTRRPIGLVLKIETRRAFERLPELLLSVMRSESAGIMIARGDLAIECGYERLAEVQEEILWIAEAAHIPVIWATQVLESLARTGQPSRSEITDAAMGQRAECIMLNKGPHIVDAIRLLDGILHRMQSHQHKKRSLLRRLESWSVAPASRDSLASHESKAPATVTQASRLS